MWLSSFSTGRYLVHLQNPLPSSKADTYKSEHLTKRGPNPLPDCLCRHCISRSHFPFTRKEGAESVSEPFQLRETPGLFLELRIGQSTISQKLSLAISFKFLFSIRHHRTQNGKRIPPPFSARWAGCALTAAPGNSLLGVVCSSEMVCSSPNLDLPNLDWLC